jgi:hypothetical protein
VSLLNKHIDTVQIKQCGKAWCQINFSNVTSVTLNKQKKAFLNLKHNGEKRYPADEDRNLCADKFSHFITTSINSETGIKGKRIGLNDFTKEALSNLSDIEKQVLNAQWKDNATQNKELGKMIAMVDVSGSMSGDPMNAAIALGIRIAEKSILGKRVMTFSNKPSWVNLSDKENFTDMVAKLREAPWGANTNFLAALNMILDAIIENKLPAEDVQDMVLVVLSDMQMDAAYKGDMDVLYKSIKSLYDL